MSVEVETADRADVINVLSEHARGKKKNEDVMAWSGPILEAHNYLSPQMHLIPGNQKKEKMEKSADTVTHSQGVYFEPFLFFFA